MTLSEETINLIIGYLGTCPYAQVAPILEKMQKDLQGQATAPVPPAEESPADQPAA